MANKRAVAEFVGTFVLVFGGVGSAVIAGEAIGALGVAFAFGLSLLAMAYAIGPISGCHINPAVTLRTAVSRRSTSGGGPLLDRPGGRRHRGRPRRCSSSSRRAQGGYDLGEDGLRRERVRRLTRPTATPSARCSSSRSC